MQDRQKLILIAAAAVGAFFLLRPGSAAAGQAPAGTKPGGAAFAPSNTGSLLSRLVGSVSGASTPAPAPASSSTAMDAFAGAATAMFRTIPASSVMDNGTSAPAPAPATVGGSGWSAQGPTINYANGEAGGE